MTGEYSDDLATPSFRFWMTSANPDPSRSTVGEKIEIIGPTSEYGHENVIMLGLHADWSTSFGQYVSRQSETAKLHEAIEALSHQINALQGAVSNLTEQVDELSESVASLAVDDDLPDLADLDEDAARAAIQAYVDANKGRDVYADEISDALGLDLLRVVRICEILREGGAIARGNV